MSLFRSGTLERRRAGGLEQIRSRYMKRPIVLTPEQERRRARIARITPRPRYMDVLPKDGDWCIFETTAQGGYAFPRVCFDTYQEAREFPAAEIPPSQGYHASGHKRDIRCAVKSEPLDLGYEPNRSGGFYVSRVSKCVSLLRR